MQTNTPGFDWTFHRMGGLDQVVFRRGDDVCRLGGLDPKLWVALSCPAGGLEFDQRTLTLVDGDRDGRIRIPEIVDAVDWTCARLKDPAALLKPRTALSLDLIDDTNTAGQRLLATARAVLERRGHADAKELSPADIEDAIIHASEEMLNGDGVLPPLAGLDAAMRAFISDALKVIGGVEDVGGQPGINAAIADAFVKSLEEWRTWQTAVDKADSPLGPKTAECWQLVTELKAKIDDYFMRCELAAYSPAAQAQLNQEDKPLTDAQGLLQLETLAEMPLSKAGPDKPLDLAAGLNPAWREKAERFAMLAGPLLSTPDRLSRSDWLALQKTLEPFSRSLSQRPVPIPPAGLTVPPTGKIEDLGEARMEEILSGDLHDRFLRLAKEDDNGPNAATDLAALERLVLYSLHLYRLLINFVNFEEFYELDERAAFQSGSLYIDGRSCHLCMPAAEVDAHADLAKTSELYLLYCACTRGRSPGGTEPEEKMNIVAAVTAGDSDLLTVSRNGVFVDNEDEDWDATVVKIVSNPISVWDAVWTPYKRFGTMVTDQIGKFAGDRQTKLMQTAGDAMDQAGAAAVSGSPPKFDIGKNVGIFAAIGLALGAIGTALGSIFNALLAMSWWQLPLVFLGLFILISGPSALLAWLKLRRRTLGPLLEASGWAINGRVTIPSAVAKQLCSVAEVPPRARRLATDPVVKMRRLRRRVFWLAVALGALATAGFFLAREHVEKKFKPADAAEKQTTKSSKNGPDLPPAMETANTPLRPPAPSGKSAQSTFTPMPEAQPTPNISSVAPPQPAL